MKIAGISLLSFFFILLTSFSPAPPDYCSDAEAYTSMEEALKEPEKVTRLDLSMTKLDVVPAEIGKLTNLVCLDLAFNKFATLPPELANCKKLRYIDLSGTHYLAKLPPVLKQLPALEAINLTDHPYWKPAQFDAAKALLPKVKMILNDQE